MKRFIASGERLYGRLRSSRFARNVLTLSAGTGAAQAIAILAMPITSRIYGPAGYGVLAAFMSVSVLVSAAATLRLSQAIVLTRDEEDAAALVGVCFVASVGVAVAAAFLAVAISAVIVAWTGEPALERWLLLIPVSVFASGASSALGEWANRHAAYRAMTINRVVAAVCQVTLSILMGLSYEGPVGLIVSLVATQIVGPLLLVPVARSTGLTVGRVRSAMRERGRAVLYEHRRFPMYSLPADLLFTYTQWVPVQILLGLSGATSVGSYTMANRLLGTPLSLLGGSIAEVFRQRASSEIAKTGECHALVVQTARTLAGISVVAFGGIALAGPELFAFALGPEWRSAGEYARILCPLFAIRFVVSPLSVLYHIRNRHLEDLALHVAMISSVAAAMFAMGHALGTPTGPVVGYSVAYSLIYVVYGVRSFKFSKAQAT